MCKYALLIGIVAAIAGDAFSATVAYEGFDYGSDAYIGQSSPSHNGGTGWAGSWVARYGTPERDQALSQDGASLTYGTTTKLETSGGRVDHSAGGAGQSTVLQRELATAWNLDATSNIVYQSFLINQPVAGSGSTLGAGLADENKNGRVFAGVNDFSDVFLGFNNSSLGIQTHSDLIVAGRTYLFVAKVVSSSSVDGDWVGLKVYDTTTDVVGTEPVALSDWTLQRNVNLVGTLSSWRQETAGGITNGQIDEIRIGERWEDVVGALPPTGLERVAALKDGCFGSPDHEWTKWVVVNYAPTRINFEPWTDIERQTYIDTYDPDHLGEWGGVSLNRGDFCRMRGLASNTTHEYGANEDLNELRGHSLGDADMAENGVARKENGSYSDDGWVGSYLMCQNAPKWHELSVQSAARQAIYGTSIFYDKFGTTLSWLDQGYCYWCNYRFKEYMRSHFADAKLAAMGFDPDTFDLSSYVASKRYLGDAILEEPIIHEYIRFQYMNHLYWAVDIIDQYHESAVKAGYPVPAFYGNQGRIGGQRVFPVVLCDQMDIVFCEQSHPYQRPLDSDVQAFSTLMWKMGRAASHYKKAVWAIQYQAGTTSSWPYGFGADKRYPTALANAEAVVNGGVPCQEWVSTGYNDQTVSETLKEGHRQHSQFVSQNRGLFVDRTSVVDHAVVYSVPSMFWRYCYGLTTLYDIPNLDHFGAAGRLLEDRHIPYNVLMLGHKDVFDDTYDLASLGNYKTIILPYVDCISNVQAEALKAWTRAGGKLVLWAEENVGTRDEELAMRSTQVFDDLIADPGSGTVETIATALADNYINKVSGSDDAIATQIEDAVSPVLQTTAPETVWLNVWQHGAGPMTSVQMFNNDLDVSSDTITPATNFTVTLREPDGVTWTHADYYNTDYDGTIEVDPNSLSFTRNGDYVEVTVPQLDVLGILVFSVDGELDARMEAGQTRKWYERLRMALRCPDADKSNYTALLEESETLLGQIQGDVVVSNFTSLVSLLQTTGASLESALDDVTVAVADALDSVQTDALNATALEKYDFGESGTPIDWTEITTTTKYSQSLGYGWLGIASNDTTSLAESFDGLPSYIFPDDLDMAAWTFRYRSGSIWYFDPPLNASFNTSGQLVLAADSSEDAQTMGYTIADNITDWEINVTVQPVGSAINGNFNVNIENGASSYGRFQVYLDKEAPHILSIRAGASGWTKVAEANLGSTPSSLELRILWNDSTKRISVYYGVNGADPTTALYSSYPQNSPIGGTHVELRNFYTGGSSYTTSCDNWTMDATVRPSVGKASNHGVTDALHRDFIRSKDPSDYASGYPGNRHFPYTNPETNPGEFCVDLPNGDYIVTVIGGDYDEYRTETGGPANEGRTAMTSVEAEGVHVLYGERGRGGYFSNRAFHTAVTDGRLDLVFSGNAVGPLYCNPIEWMVNGLVIQTENQTITPAAQAYLDRSDLLNGAAIRSWMVIGPFDDDDCRGIETDYGPETDSSPDLNWPGKDGTVAWQSLPTLIDPAPFVSLSNILVDTNEVAAYCQSFVYCPKALNAQLVYSTSQTGVGWLNGMEIFRDEIATGLLLEEETVEIALQPGWNSILIKSMNHWGSKWSLHASLLNEAGNLPLAKMPGIVVSTQDNIEAIYMAWISKYSVGSETNMEDNPDADSLNNLYEWGLGGDPTNSFDVGHVPTYGIIKSGGTNWFEFVHAKRTDADHIGLTYHLEQNTNLADGVWTNANYEVVGTSVLDTKFDIVTNRVSTDVEASQFLKLIIEPN